MSDPQVTSISIGQLLSKLREGEWLVPQFQREFVWTVSNVEDLIASTLAARPIGMATLWEQSDDSGLELDHVSLPDTPTKSHPSEISYFGDPDERANRNYAILDGRQRSTALAMAFGGFRQTYGARKFSGAFFLDVTEQHDVRPVRFVKKAQLERESLDRDEVALSKGLVPLAVKEGTSLDARWFQLGRDLSNTTETDDGLELSEQEVAERVARFDKAHENIRATRLAVYTVPAKYDLGEICEIFETLNTTGTRVSTVDLVHSWLYADSYESHGEPLLLRDWIRELGQVSGAEGWADESGRPELMAQTITACYVAAIKKEPPRQVGRRSQDKKIKSIKAGDLLATPTTHWRTAMESDALLASWFSDLQDVIANGRFTHNDCPYPASTTIYVALRWHKQFDHESATPWHLDDLDALFRAFYWRNVLSTRYDQGFLTQVGADIVFFKDHLSKRSEFDNTQEWSEATDEALERHMASALPTVDFLTRQILDGGVRGALRQAFVLPMKSRVTRDLLRTGLDIRHPDGVEADLHHLFPKAWLRDNATGELREQINQDELDPLNSAANLLPLSAKSNREWRAKAPGVALFETDLTDETRSALLSKAMIDSKALEALEQAMAKSDTDELIREFFQIRARNIADWLLAQTHFEPIQGH